MTTTPHKPTASENNETNENPPIFGTRDRLLNEAVAFTSGITGKTARDRALFDYLCGAAKALHVAGLEPTDCPPWLWIIGIRAGSRLKEIEKMIHE